MKIYRLCYEIPGRSPDLIGVIAQITNLSTEMAELRAIRPKFMNDEDSPFVHLDGCINTGAPPIMKYGGENVLLGFTEEQIPLVWNASLQISDVTPETLWLSARTRDDGKWFTASPPKETTSILPNRPNAMALVKRNMEVRHKV